MTLASFSRIAFQRCGAIAKVRDEGLSRVGSEGRYPGDRREDVWCRRVEESVVTRCLAWARGRLVMPPIHETESGWGTMCR